MAKYTIEDIEILRKKSGISYEEAVNLLEYHNGSLARSLVDLEKNGRIKQEKKKVSSHKGLRKAFDFLYRMRLIVTRKDLTILNLSALFVIVEMIFAPHLCIFGLIVALVLGYHVTVKSNSPDFAEDSLEDMVHNAAKNVQENVRSFTQQFSSESEQPKKEAKAPEEPRSESAPTNTRPVNVQFPDGGSVGVRDDGDGYHEADIQ